MSIDVRTSDPFHHYVKIDPEEQQKYNPAAVMAVLSKHDDRVDEKSVDLENENSIDLENSVDIENSVDVEKNDDLVPPPATRLWKQQSWSPNELLREEAWMKRRDQFRLRRRKSKSLTDEDLDELRGCIDLGFGFGYPEEEEDHSLCNTLPALDFYYAVNRNFNDCKFKSSPSSSTTSMTEQSSDNRSEDGPNDQHYDAWRISSPGENPQLVKTRLRHWAQLVACSIRQSS